MCPYPSTASYIATTKVIHIILRHHWYEKYINRKKYGESARFVTLPQEDIFPYLFQRRGFDGKASSFLRWGSRCSRHINRAFNAIFGLIGNQRMRTWFLVPYRCLGIVQFPSSYRHTVRSHGRHSNFPIKNFFSGIYGAVCAPWEITVLIAALSLYNGRINVQHGQQQGIASVRNRDRFTPLKKQGRIRNGWVLKEPA